jgi:hypothetical protein
MPQTFVVLAVAAFLAACQPATTEPPPSAPAEPTPAPAPAPTPSVQPSATVITSEGWGDLRIGMTRAQVVAAAGEDAAPNAVGGADPESCDEFRPARAPEPVLVMIENGVLTRISLIRASDIKSDRGFGVGDTAAAVKAAYGAAAMAEPHKYEAAPAEYITSWSRGGGSGYVQDPAARGLVYEIGGDGKVKAIRAGGPSIQYVEGCA